MGKAMGFAVNAFKAFHGFQIGKFFLDSAAGIEKTQTQLKTLTGSAQQADKIFNELLTLPSSHRLLKVDGAARKLKAFGVETEDVVKTTTQLARLLLQRDNRLTELHSLMAKSLPKAGCKVKSCYNSKRDSASQRATKRAWRYWRSVCKMVSLGQISSQQVVEAFNQMTGASQFNNAFENTANLLTTKLTNLQSAVTLFASAFTNAFGPIIKTALDGATMLIEKLTQAILSADAGKLTQEKWGIQESPQNC